MCAKYRPVPWQRNFRKVPQGIVAKVRALPGEDLRVACIKKIPARDIWAGHYRHLGITLPTVATEQPTFVERVLPQAIMGRYSRINLNGATQVYQNRPKVVKTFVQYLPSWNSDETHPVPRNREVYQRDFVPPEELEITVSLLGTEGDGQRSFVFRFQVEKVLRRTDHAFQRDLLRTLNLLQENVGRVDVFSSNATLEDYLGAMHVAWEILPAGTQDEMIAIVLAGIRQPSVAVRNRVQERLRFLLSLNPQHLITGTSGFRRYIGAQFHDRLVAFENAEYGNAMYVMFANWQERSKLSRTELLKGSHEDFERIIHTRRWEDKVRRVIAEHR